MLQATVFRPNFYFNYHSFAIDSTGGILYGFCVSKIDILRLSDFSLIDTVKMDITYKQAFLSGDNQTIFLMDTLGDKIVAFDVGSKRFSQVARFDNYWYFQTIFAFGNSDLITSTCDGLFWIDGKTGATKLEFDNSYEICLGTDLSKVNRHRVSFLKYATVNNIYFHGPSNLLLCATPGGMYVFDCLYGNLVFRQESFGECYSFGYLGLYRFLVGFDRQVKLWHSGTNRFYSVLGDMELSRYESRIAVYPDKSHAIIALDSRVFILYDTKTGSTSKLNITIEPGLNGLAVDPSSGDVFITKRSGECAILKMQPAIAFTVYKGLVEFQGTKYKNAEIMSDGRIIGYDGRLIGTIDKN